MLQGVPLISLKGDSFFHVWNDPYYKRYWLILMTNFNLNVSLSRFDGYLVSKDQILCWKWSYNHIWLQAYHLLLILLSTDNDYETYLKRGKTWDPHYDEWFNTRCRSGLMISSNLPIYPHIHLVYMPLLVYKKLNILKI